MKKIAGFTSIRSEYCLLSQLLYELDSHPAFELELLAGGAHLTEAFGKTIRFIEEDGFTIAHKFPFLFSDEEKDVLCRSLSVLQHQIGSYLANSAPDLLLVLGDRFELIPVVLAATLYNIPVAHLSGGETTEGAIDNQVRHALTKFSHIHFPATEKYASNIRAMGEEPWRICVAGEPGLDLIHKLNFIDKSTLFSDLRLKDNLPTVLVTFHPQTINDAINASFIEEVVQRILVEGYQVIATASNFDQGGAEINRCYESMATRLDNFVYHLSLGQKRYYSLLYFLTAMVGNSSSGLVEAQSFDLPVVNVGDRQKGRLANPSVLTVSIDSNAIINALAEIKSQNFISQYTGKKNIYGDGQACKRIIAYLENLDWNKVLNKKDCFDEKG